MIGRKAEIVDHGLALHSGHLEDPLEVLRRLGGRELAAIAGTIIAARTQVAVLLEGFAATAAAAVLHRANPAALDHCLLAYVGAAEPGHRPLAGEVRLTTR